jgi:hypothetical protein
MYERYARWEPDYNRLRKLVRDGTNVLLCGPDAHPMPDVETAYLSKSKPFSHERCLYAMLTVGDGDRAQLPWVKHKTFEF